MDSCNSFERWSNFELVSKEEDFDVFSFPIQPFPLDLPVQETAPTLDFQFDISIQETSFDAFPLMEYMPVHDSFYSIINFEQSQNMVHEMHLEGITSNEVPIENKIIRRQRKKKGSSSKTLSRATISKHFYMPLTRAAKELNVGLTILKKKCWELGICRWPHRKLKSLETLIKKVQGMRNEEEEGYIAEKNLREAIEILEREKKLMEEIPDMQLEDRTKRLRQTWLKANYKKKKLNHV